MHHKPLVFIFLFQLLSFCVFSQEKIHRVNLAPKKAVGEKNFFVTSVIDNRENKANIGFAQIGFLNKKVPAKFEHDFEFHLMRAFIVLLPMSREKEQLIVRVNKLYITEETMDETELGVCEIEMEFLKEEDTTLIVLKKCNAIVQGTDVDATGKHDKRIIKAITDCINQYSNSIWKESDYEYVVGNDEVRYKYDYKAPLKKGLYFKYDNLIRNNPVDSIGYELKQINNNDETPHFQIYNKKTDKRIKRLLGFSDGKYIYLNARSYTSANYFVKSELIGRYIYFEDKYYSDVAAVAFGIIGGLLTYKHVGIVLDTKRGEVKVLDNLTMETILTPHPEILAKYKSKDKSIELTRTTIEEVNKALE